MPSHIKEIDSLMRFKKEIKNWKPENCPCRLCKNYIPGIGLCDYSIYLYIHISTCLWKLDIFIFSSSNSFIYYKSYVWLTSISLLFLILNKATILVKTVDTNSRFTTKIDISSHMESLNFQSANDETA